MIEVYRNSTQVYIDGRNVKATIVSTLIEGNVSISYQCVWWDKLQRKCEWVKAYEVTPVDSTDTLKIGFRNVE